MDPFVLTIIIIFVVTLIVSYLKSILRDRCLKDFDKFPVIVLLKNGKSIWGRMRLKSSGFILTYDQPYDNISHLEYGFIIYRNEFSTIFSIVRLISDLSESEKRLREIRKKVEVFKAILWLRKKARNFFAAVRDAFVDTFSMFLGKYGAKSSLISQNQRYVKSLGTTVIDYIGNSYDPILEGLIGKRVVYEVFESETWKEYTGVLKNYSKDFLEILETKISIKLALKLRENQRKASYFNVEILKDENQITVLNKRNNSIKLILENGDVMVDPDQQIELDQDSSDSVKLMIELSEKVDVVLPRSSAVVRHLAEG